MRPHRWHPLTPYALRWLLLLPGLLLLTAILPAGPALGAQEAPTWEPLGLGEPALELYTPASGALFVRTAGGLSRSDDGGATWRPVELPPRGQFQHQPVVAVDPIDHTTIFADGEGGLYRTSDDAATWTRLALPPRTGSSIRSIVVSPADRMLVYVATASSEDTAGTLWLLRSSDGGATWGVLKESNAGPGCGYGVELFQAHPTDPNVAFLRAGCYRGEPKADPLERSLDRGLSWNSITSILVGNTLKVVGGQGADPHRFYLAANKPDGPTGQVFRSAGEYLEWTPALELAGTAIGGLAYDPAVPDHVYAGTAQGAVLASTDAGLSWAPLGQDGLGAIHDLALGIDGQNLFAATDQGVWRLALGTP